VEVAGRDDAAVQLARLPLGERRDDVVGKRIAEEKP
jgi:hypothetical protein